MGYIVHKIQVRELQLISNQHRIQFDYIMVKNINDISTDQSHVRYV